MNSKFFCYYCMKIPAINISITKNGIEIIHKCKKGDKIIKFELNNNWKLNDSIPFCFFCEKKLAKKICLKCLKNVCLECIGSHNVIDLFDLQFYCIKHQKKITFCCEICQKNLCEKCIHYHINNRPANEKNIEISFSFEKSNNALIKYLSQIIKNDYYSNIIKTSEIFHNFTLLKLIDINSSKIINEENVVLSAETDININAHLCKTRKDFKKNFKKLIFKAKLGEYDCYCELEDLITFYSNLFQNNDFQDDIEFEFQHHLEKELSSIELDYHFFIDAIKGNSLFNIVIELFKMSLQNKINLNVLKFKNKILFDICKRMLNKLDFESRRKISNLISLEIYKCYKKYIVKINPNDYYNLMAIIKLKSKYSELDSKTERNIKTLKENKEKILSNLEKSLENCKNYINDELINVKNKKVEKIDFDENSNIIFYSSNENEKKLITILNIFQLIKKEMGYIFNNNIHNLNININNILLEVNLHKNYDENMEIFNEKDKSETNYCIPYIVEKVMKDFNIQFKKEDTKLSQIFNEIFNEKEDFNMIYNDLKNTLENFEKEYSFKSSLKLNNALQYYYFNNNITEIYEEKVKFFNSKIIPNKSEISDSQKKLINSLINEISSNELEFKLITNLKIKYETYFIRHFQSYLTKSGNNSLERIKNIISKSSSMNLKTSDLLFYDENKIFEFNSKIVMFYFFINNYILSNNDLNKNKIKLKEFMKEYYEKHNLINTLINKKDNLNDETIYMIWDKLKKKNKYYEEKSIDKTIIEEINQKIKDYLNSNSPQKYVEELNIILKEKIVLIDLNKKDPQDLSVQLFMEQQKLDIEKNNY